MGTFLCRHLHQPDGWLSPGVVRVDEDGIIEAVDGGAVAAAERDSIVELDGWVVPGLANVHSHAFQRAMVGRAEHAGTERDDSFWTWRTAMYELALALAPEDLEAIAAQLYLEMLEAGMTAVGEFHYLHHDRDGARYADRAEMGGRIIAAARQVGIGLTLLPVLYLHGGFGQPASPMQRRFVHRDVEDFLATLGALRMPLGKSGMVRLGVAPHSLRAVDGASLTRVLQAVRTRDAHAPVHIHIAEQTREVDEAVAHLGARPVSWLLREIEVDAGFCLVHATHLDDQEIRELARSSAIVGLCPTTEANLGDGFFPALAYMRAGGRFAIGSDSHATVSAIDELRTLEYGQRLVHERRNLLCDVNERHVGRFLFDHVAGAGARAVDQPMGALTPGLRADMVVLDAEHPRLVSHHGGTVLDAWILGAAEGAIKQVFVAGMERVRDGMHVARASVFARFREVMTRLYRG